jgi:methionyl aminopeptidase
MSQVIIKTPAQIEGIRQSCQLAAQTLVFTASLIKPGISTQYLNDQAHDFIIKNHAIPAPLGYNGFPKSICTSINNVVCHGIPSPKELLKEGDIINIDITTILNGYYGDTSASYPVGNISKMAADLIDRTQKAMYLAIDQLKPGKSLNQSVGRTIQNYLKPFNYGIVRLLGGHGVGLSFHEEPFVYHYDTLQSDVTLVPGMVFTIEPMINSSPKFEVTVDNDDGWTVRTTDGALSAQFEHTVLITDLGREILTEL